MYADVCIYDTDGHNLHAHIILTVWTLAKDGKQFDLGMLVHRRCFFLPKAPARQLHKQNQTRERNQKQ